MALDRNSAPDISGRCSLGCKGVGLGFRFAAAGGPRMLTPADFTMTSSVRPGASSKVMFVFSSALVSILKEVRLRKGRGVSGVAGDES